MTTLAKLLALGWAAAQSLTAATVVDWLELTPGSGSPAFQLANDDGVPQVTGNLTITNGIGFPGTPGTRSLDAAFWSATIGLLDSQTLAENVTGFGIRVVPSGGVASYRLDFDLPSGVPLVFTVGGLFADASAATDAVALSFVSSLGPGIPQLHTIVSWDDGGTSFSQALDWDPGTGILSTQPGSDGDSRIAFFTVPALPAGSPSLRIDVPDGLNTGVGDEIFIAVATVPEPSGLALTLLASGLLLRRWRRP